MSAARSVLDTIGNTPIMQLRHVVPKGSDRILATIEWANPTGSMKDRMAKAVIEAAAKDGRLPPGATVVEYTAGTTGIALAFVCAATGHKLEVVFSDAFSEEKWGTMRAFGAEITGVKSEGKRIVEKLIKEMIATSEEITKRPGHWRAGRLTKRDAIAGCYPLGRRSGGRWTAAWTRSPRPSVRPPRTTGLRRSCGGARQPFAWPRWNPRNRRSSGGPSGSHQIEVIGIGFLPPLFEPEEADEIIAVRTAGAKANSRRLARSEGLFAGTSSGASAVAALKVAERLGPDALVRLPVDPGLRCRSTDVYR